MALAYVPGARAQMQSMDFPDQSLLKKARIAWEGDQLIFYATFRQYGHDMPLWLEWQAGKASGRAEIDEIEQYGLDIPIAVTLVTLGKTKAGKPLWYIGVAAPNSQQVEADGLLGDLTLTDDAGVTSHYSFTLTGGATATPVIRPLPR